MNLWHTDTLIKQLQTRSLRRTQKFLYLLGMIALSAWEFNTFFFIPNLYHYLMPYIKEILEEKAGSIQLTITVFDTGEVYFKDATFFLIVFFVLMCYFLNRKGDKRHFFGRMICLSVPLTIRFTIIFSVIYTAICGSIFGYFFYQLMELQKMLEPLPSIGFKGWITSVATKFNIVKTISTKLEAMHKAQFIYEQISQASYAFHLLAHALALCASILFFWALARNIYIVSTYKRSSE